MLDNVAQSRYSDAVDSYTALNVSSKVRGELIEKQDKNIRIDIGNDEALEIELKEDIDIKKGDTVLIDRRNIVKSKVINLKDEIKIESGDIESYSDVLKSLNIDITEENIKIIKRLDNYGIDITKENFETYVISKNALNDISTSLDYESTIRLMEMDIDVENESIDKLASLVGELEEEKEGFKLLDMFKKKELTTEEAESIAKELYGSKMGKDIVDIIKSLHKKKVNITKKNIEKINDVFYKLDKLGDIEDKTFVNTIKNKLEINIDNLYKVKRYVKDESISKETSVVTTVSVANRIINIKGYEIPTQEKHKVTNRDLKLLEEDIRDLMIDLELEPSKENINLSKEFIKRDMNVTKENINSVDDMKKALKVIIKNLDKEMAAELTKENIDIETMDIRKIAEHIDKVKTIEKPIPQSETEVELIKSEETLEIHSKQSFEEADIEQVEITEKQVAQSEIEKEQMKIEVIPTDSEETLEIQNKQSLEQENINNIIKKIELLEKVDEKDILTLIEKNVDFKINKIEQIIFGKREPISIEKIEDITYSQPAISRNDISKDITLTVLGEIEKISTAFNDIGELDFNTIEFQMKRNIPLTLANMQKTSNLLATTNSQNQEKIEVSVPENINTDKTSPLNIQKSMEAYRSYNNIKQNLTSNMVVQAVADDIKIENMDINLASRYVDQYRKTNFINNKEYMQKFTENAYEITKNSDENIMFLMKNKRPISFKELRETNSMFKNEDQIGHKVSDMAKLVDKDGDLMTKEKFENLKKDIVDISKSMKNSKEDVEEAYRRVEDSVRDFEDNMKFVGRDNETQTKSKAKNISQAMDESKVILKENEIVQLPLYMNSQFTNLNMYFRDREREGREKDPEDISAVISIDTVNMGNININLDIEKKKVNVKIGLENIDDKTLIESHKDILEKLLEQGGYSIGEISFYGEEKFNILVSDEESKTKPSMSSGNLDITV